MSWGDLLHLLPELVLLATAFLVVLIGLVMEAGGGDSERPAQATAVVGLLGTAIAFARVLLDVKPSGSALDLFSGAFVLDHLALWFQAILLIFAFVTILLGWRFSRRFKPHQSEFMALILLATVGGMFMASAREMIQLFVSLETLSISLYVLTAFNKGERLSSEAGFKYLVFGAASSAVLLYGLAILYGLTGRTELAAVAAQVTAQGSSPALVLAAIFVIGGLSFKIAAVPFHQWVPDVYQGAPTPVTAFISVSSKAAGYALLVRVLTSALLPIAPRWGVYIAVASALTMTIGNVSALGQTSLKRLLGYSSIAQAGYLMLGLVALSAGGPAATLGLGGLLFYLLVYGLTNLAAFACVEAAEAGLGGDDIALFAGLGRRAGPLALILSVCLVSLTGVPPLIGFFAKLFVFLAAVQAGYTWLVLLALANSALSSVYYLRFVRAMYLDEGRETRRLSVPLPVWVVMGIGMVAIVPLSILAGQLADVAQKGASAVLR
jgi:NAD(P)H-quinone oxidoreductase subunit 2